MIGNGRLIDAAKGQRNPLVFNGPSTTDSLDAFLSLFDTHLGVRTVFCDGAGNYEVRTLNSMGSLATQRVENYLDLIGSLRKEINGFKGSIEVRAVDLSASIGTSVIPYSFQVKDENFSFGLQLVHIHGSDSTRTYLPKIVIPSSELRDAVIRDPRFKGWY
jgi:hypothetical protein